MSRQISGLLKQQERFVSDAAHELCSPISRLQMVLELLRASSGRNGETKTDEQASHERYLEDLAEEIQEMSSLIEDLLFYSRSKNQKLTVRLEDLQLAIVVQKVIDQEVLSGDDVMIAIPKSLYVHASESHVRRALANLLRNAQQYAGEAGKVEITAYENGPEVHLLVRDHGPGIPEGELRQVFAPFYRVEYARSRRTGGTGLGLAIVQSSVEACGGSVTCRNRRPSGLEVEIILPGSPAPASPTPRDLATNHTTLHNLTR
jgi:two-component system sensor histidine kinase CpxA